MENTIARPTFGGHNSSGTPDFVVEGKQDEVRISSTARSADWIALQQLSMTDALLIFDAEENWVPAGGGALLTCSATSAANINFVGTRMDWQFTNTGGAPITLESLTLIWPNKNHDLLTVKSGTSTLFGAGAFGPSVVVSDSYGNFPASPADRIVAPAETVTLELTFAKNANDGDYYLFARFEEDCVVDFRPPTDRTKDSDRY